MDTFDPKQNWYYCPESDRKPPGYGYTVHQPVSYDEWREWGIVPVKKWDGTELVLEHYKEVIAYECRYCGHVILGDFITSANGYGSPGGVVVWCRALIIEEEWWT